MAGERKGNAAYALADLLSRRGLERPCETLVEWAREALNSSVAPTYEQLRAMSDEEVIAFHDSSTANMAVGLSFALDELARRATERQTAAMLEYTKSIRTLTSVIALLTAVNVVVSVLLLAYA